MSETIEEYPPEAVQRICQHMNEDHYVSVYAMAKSMVHLRSGWKLTGSKLKKVTPTGCHIQAIACSGDLCEAHNVVYPLPNVSQANLRSILVNIHHKETSPKLSWFVKKPMALILLVVIGISAWLLLFADRELLDETTAALLKEKAGIEVPITLSSALAFVSCLTLVAHSLEVIFVAYYGHKHLKFSNGTIAKWAPMVLVLGFPILTEFLDLLDAYRKDKQERKQSKNQ